MKRQKTTLTLNVEIESELLKDFRCFAVNKTGKLHGAIKPEVNIALRNHLINNGYYKK